MGSLNECMHLSYSFVPRCMRENKSSWVNVCQTHSCYSVMRYLNGVGSCRAKPLPRLAIVRLLLARYLHEIYCASRSLLLHKTIFFKSLVFIEECFVAPCAWDAYYQHAFGSSWDALRAWMRLSHMCSFGLLRTLFHDLFPTKDSNKTARQSLFTDDLYIRGHPVVFSSPRRRGNCDDFTLDDTYPIDVMYLIWLCRFNCLPVSNGR